MKIARSVGLLRFGGVLTFGCGLRRSFLLGNAFSVGGVAGYASEGLRVVIDGGKRAQEEAIDIGEGAGATRRDASLSAKLIERAKRTIDALGILKVVGPVGEDLGDVFRVAGRGGRVTRTEGAIRIYSNRTALTSSGGAVLAALMRQVRG